MDSNEALNPEDNMLSHWSPGNSPEEAMDHFVQCDFDVEKIFPSLLRQNDGISFLKQLDAIISSNRDDSCTLRLLKAVSSKHSVKRLIKITSSVDATDYMNVTHVASNIVRIVEAIYAREPNLSIRTNSLLNTVDVLLDRALNNTGRSEKGSIERLQHFRDEVQNLQKNISIFSLESLGHANDEMMPPEDFRSIPIFPSEEDIFISGDGKPFLRKNITRGSYADPDHYLDVQFRLLREDCISQMRKGILEYIQKKEATPKSNSFRLQDARLYNIAQIVNSEMSPQGKLYVVQLDSNKAKSISWNKTSRLKYGSLICLSPDDFKTLYFGVVVENDGLNKDHTFKVQIAQKDGRQIPVFGNLRIIESTAYFENYRHSLRYLQEIEYGELPFERYIVQCQREIKAPAYLEPGNSTFDFSSNISGSNIYDFTGNSKGDLFQYDILKDEWPTAKQMKMDDSQYRAFKSALRQEFSIIQGPPGTGKTYLTLQIAKALLRNQSLWNRDDGSAPSEKHPMVVVCLTNHALDKFMEGILEFMRPNDMQADQCGIVRVGSRCQNEAIEQFSVKNLRGKHSKYRNNQRNRNEIQRIYQQILETKYCLSESRKGIVSTKELSSVVDIDVPFRNPHVMHRWLGVSERSWMNMVRRFLLETNDLQLNEGHHTRSDVDETAEKSFDKSEQNDIDFFEIKRVENSTYILNLHRQMKNLMTKYSRKLPKYAKTYLLNVLSENIKCTNQGSSITKQRDSEITAHRNQIWKISKATRWNLYRFWLRKWRESKQKELSLLQEELEKTIHVYESTKKEIDSDILKESRVIAMTITGASKNQDIMSRVGPRILIVEEAAETLEAQVISALSPSCQQIILVGDHKQLEPQPAVFELAQKYNLSLSLFHRMIKNGLPFNVLENQHRMRPGISKLVRPIYKTLYDSPEVFCYPGVEGIKQNIYFFNHCLEETLTDESTSYSNPFEAHFVKGLCKYLLARGHESSQITVLTPYSKQMFAIRDIMPWHEFGINTTCLDRFQGDENDIIILSLVRSNQEGNIGFLGKENRACVALSRAKIGLYVVGNIDQLCRYSKTDIWRRTARKLTGTCLGSNLPLDNICIRHFGFDSLICSAEDFNTVQMGTGCNNPCGEHLSCGHVCRLTCHDIDSVEHHCLRLCLKICQNGHTCERLCHDQSPCFCESLVTTKLVCGHEMAELCHVQQEKKPGQLITTIPCQLICQVTCENGHVCSKKCHYPQPCLCPVETEKILSCGHKAIAICNEDPGSKDCSKIIEKELKCGHRIRDKCSSDLSQYRCMENVTKTLGNCGHEAEMSCSQNPSEFSCTKVVKRKLQCDHIVEMECHLRSEEYKCQIMILDKFECGHESSFPCYMRGKDNKCTAFVTEQRENCHHLRTRECWERNEIASSACEEPKLMKRSECNHFFTVTCHNFTKASSLSKSEREEFIRKLESETGLCNEEFKIGFPCKHDLQSVTCSQLRTAECKQVCGHLCSNDHRCEKICHYPDECECETPILIQLPECGHWTKVPCSKSKGLSKTCSRMSGMMFPECHELIKVRHPTHRYEVTVPCPQKERLLKLFTQNRRYGRFPSNLKLDRDCGHFEKTDYFDPKLSGCNSKCEKTLACGHVCRNTCDRCLPGELHAQCYSSCGNTLICGHNCKSDICGSCKLCDMDCEHMCTHMKCELKCSMPCQRCTEPCHWSCPHHKCSNMCGEVCNRPRCNIRCERKLPCGHTCSGFCGDPCPEPCRLCNVEELKKLTTVDLENAVFIQLECTHIFESGMLDLELDKQWRRIQRIHCPRCRTAIKTHPRYTDIRNSVFNFRESAKLQLLYMSQRLGIEKVPFSSPHCSEYRNFVEKFGIYLVQTEEIWKLTNRNAYEIIDNLHDEVSQFLEEKTRFSPKVQQSIDIYHAFLKMDVFWQYGIVVCAHLKLDTPFTLYGTTDLCEEEADDEIPDVKVDKKISELGEKVLSFISKYSLRTDLFSDLSSELKEALGEVEESKATCPLTKACSTPQRPYVLDPHARHWTICNKGHIFSKVMNEEECYFCHDIDFYSEVEVFRREGMSVTLDARRPGIIKVQANITAKGGNEVQTIEKRGDQNLTSTLHGVKNEIQQDRNINVEVSEDVDQINDKTIRQREELSTTSVYNNALYGRSSSCDRRTSFSKTLQEFGRVSSADNVAACINESNSVSNGRDQLYRGETRQNGESKTIVGRRNHLSSEDLRRQCMENLKRRKENEIFLKQNNLPKSKTNVTKKDFDGSIRASSCDRSANVWNRFDTLRRVCSAEDLTNQTSNGKGKSENEIYSSETTTDESESKDGVNEQDEAWVKVETRRRKRHQDKIEAKYNNQQEERSGRKRHKKRFQRKSNKKEGKPDDRTKDGLSKHDLNKTTDYNLINSPVAFTMAEFPPLSAQCNVKVKETKSDKESTSMPCKVDPIHNKKAQTDIFGEPRNFIEKKNKIEHADEIKMPETPNLQTAQMCSNPFDMNEKKFDENIGSFGLEVKDEGMRHRSSSCGGTANPSGRNTMQTKNETHGQTSSGLRNLEEYKVHVSKRILEGDVEGTSIISTRSSTQESLNKMKLEESCRMDSSETAIQNKGNTGTEDNNGQKVFDWQSSIPVKNITRRRNRSTSLDLRRKVIQNLQGNYEREQSNSTSRKSFPSKSDRSQNYCKHTEFDRKTLSGGCEGKNLDTSTRVFSADHMKRLLNQEESKPVKPNAAQTVVGSATGGTDKIKRFEQSPVTVKRRMKQREKLTLIAVNTLGRQSTMRSESKNIEAECKLEPNVNSSCQSSDLQEFLGAPIVESWDSSDSC